MVDGNNWANVEMQTEDVRAKVVARRTYNRPLDDSGLLFESWGQTVDRVISHQRWLWERAKKRKLFKENEAELEELRQLMLDRKVLTSGRTLWLGGTDVAKKREASQFNCSFLEISTVYDVVDALWLLLQGCGVGFKPIVGNLNGFPNKIENIQVVRSTRTTKGGLEKMLNLLIVLLKPGLSKLVIQLKHGLKVLVNYLQENILLKPLY